MSDQSLRHVAIIMDGNNRWAKAHGKSGIAGHKAGVERIRDVLKACQQHQIDVLTVFAFSSENWKRPRKEVDALMGLFLSYLKNETKKLVKEGVRLRVIGRRDRFSEAIVKAIEHAEKATASGFTTLVIAADYGGQWDVADVAQRLVREVAAGRLSVDDINVDQFDRFSSTADFPPLDLLIRTSGEQRISNFLLWQCAYAELYFTPTYWPDFDAAELDAAVTDFYSRQRRFGLRDHQVVAEEDSSC